MLRVLYRVLYAARLAALYVRAGSPNTKIRIRLQPVSSFFGNITSSWVSFGR